MIKEVHYGRRPLKLIYHDLSVYYALKNWVLNIFIKMNTSGRCDLERYRDNFKKVFKKV